MRKSDFTLFFSMPLDAQDWANLAASHVVRVMLPLDLADVATLDRLHSMGVRVVLRVGEDRYYTDDAPARIVNQVQACQNHASVAAVILGCEPDAGFSFEDGAASWGQPHCYRHRTRFDMVRTLLQGAGFAVISPALSMRSISEDEPAQPGQYTWAEILRLSYDRAYGNAVHLYTYNWLGVVDQGRVKFALKHYEGMWHRPIWIDEVNIDSGAPIDRMQACIAIASLLLTHQLGKRVAMFCPFVSNGNPSGWPAGYLMRDPACYTELGAWMTS